MSTYIVYHEDLKERAEWKDIGTGKSESEFKSSVEANYLGDYFNLCLEYKPNGKPWHTYKVTRKGAMTRVI